MDLRNYIQGKGEYLEFDKSCHTVKEAAETLGISEDAVVKNVCFTDGSDIIIAIVPGNRKASRVKISGALGRKVKIASPEQIQKIGYPPGGVPSFGFKAVFLIDEYVMNKPEVYTSGGSAFSMIRISTSEMRKLNNGSVADISE